MVCHPFAGLKIATRALKGEGDRRPADRLRGRDLVAQGGLVDPLDGDDELRRLTAYGPARLGVVAKVTVDAKADVDPFPLGERVDHVVHDTFGRFHPGLATADVAGHRAGEIEDELEIDGADQPAGPVSLEPPRPNVDLRTQASQRRLWSGYSSNRVNARCTQPGEHVRERIVSPLQLHVHGDVHLRLPVQVSITRS